MSGNLSNHDLLALLARLDEVPADALESEWLDFKPWTGTREDMKVAVEYAVCFANAGGGVVVFGVDDKPVGRMKAIHGAKGYDLERWRRDIFDSTRPNLAVEVFELAVPEGTGKVLGVRVDAGGSKPYGTASGVFKQRVGKSCMPLDSTAFNRQSIQTAAVDWSGAVAQGVELSDLDPIEIARGRQIAERLRPQSDIPRLSDTDFLAALGAIREGNITHTGLLLFGKETVLSRLCPQHLVQYVWQSGETQVARNDQFRFGLLHTLERIEQIFTSPANPERELTLGLQKLRIPAYHLDVVREAVLNAVTHRDYSDPGKVLIRQLADELVITSPGGFMPGITPENILRHEPKSRNNALANAFLKLGLVESSGIGRRRIFVLCLSLGKPIPLYESDGHSVTLHVYDKGHDENTARLVARWRDEGREVGLEALMVLAYLRQNAFIDSSSASRLLQRPLAQAREILDQFALPRTGILERRGHTPAATFHLAKGIAKDLLGKAAYTKTRGLNPIRYAEMVKAYLQDHGSISPKECRELLGLGESQSAKVEISRYLRNWSTGQNGFLVAEGHGSSRRYALRANPE
ncbi:MAG: RNA-binding domain-containing protein [Gammaproteobacteria bacterium]